MIRVGEWGAHGCDLRSMRRVGDCRGSPLRIANARLPAGRYDLARNWVSLEGTPSPDVQGVTLFTAFEEQLGLKLVPSKSLGQDPVIDYIERPSEN